jgi:hypothetical protein
MENHHFSLENSLQMVIFHSYVSLPEGNPLVSHDVPFQHGRLRGVPHFQTPESPLFFDVLMQGKRQPFFHHDFVGAADPDAPCWW